MLGLCRTPLQLGPWGGNAAFVLLMVGRGDFNVSEEQEIQKAISDFAWQSSSQETQHNLGQEDWVGEGADRWENL